MATNPEIIIPTKEQILEVYMNHLSSKGAARQHVLSYASEFLEYAEGDYTRATIEKYMEHIKRKHEYKDSSLNFIFRVIRTMFNRNKLDWPFNRGEAPMVRESSILAPALGPRTVRRAIAAVKKSDDAAAKAFLALSTVYGVRRQEIMNITAEDIRYKDKTIYIATLKHGRERTHLLPDEIIPYLQDYDFDTPRSGFGMLMLWYSIERMIDFKHLEHVGFHSIRRTVETLLEREFKDLVLVRNFMRWKTQDSNDMVQRYSATQFVGDDEEYTELNEDSKSVDQLIFAKREDGTYRHPFLGDWK